MKNSGIVTGTQALDDYFDALLNENLWDENVVFQGQESENKGELKREAPRAICPSSPDFISLAQTQTQDGRDLASVEKLLRDLKLDDSTAIKMLSKTSVRVNLETDPKIESETASKKTTMVAWKNIISDDLFQVLFFESVGVTYAVPLAQLGGIYRLGVCHHLIGRPDWYLGTQIEQKKQLDVVDTAKWVMPEKRVSKRHRDDYSYIVLLGNSHWSLACNALRGTQSLTREDVKWREQAGKSPWLAGLVKEKRCVLIHVKALITMLNQGMNANALAKLI